MYERTVRVGDIEVEKGHGLNVSALGLGIIRMAYSISFHRRSPRLEDVLVGEHVQSV